MSRRQEIIDRALALPQLPASVHCVSALLQDENADMDAVVRAVEMDPGMTANILRMANSSYFGGVRNVGTVREAVVRLGVKRVMQLTLATGVAQHAKVPVKGYGLEPEAMLEHSIALGLAAELLGKELDLDVPAHAFTGGLLANIGKIVLGSFVEVDAGPIQDKAQQEGLTFEEAEAAVLGIDHAELGALLLEHWELPREIVQVVRWRYRPGQAPEPSSALDLVHAGDMLVKMSGIALGLDGLQYSPSAEVLDRLGLTPEVQTAVMASIQDHLAEMRDLFAGCGGCAA
jgi:HD-like signal output (HDOD) protein